MSVHTNPRQCLANLSQQLTDGGRAEFLEQEWKSTGTIPEMPTGDCAVVALVHAAFWSPSRESYEEARYSLSKFIRPWMFKARNMNEKPSDYRLRRIRQWIRAPRRNPIHGTPSHATSLSIRILLGYEHIYPNQENRWYCICDMESAYVLDVQTPYDHTMTVHERVAYTTAHFDPNETEVGNVHQLNPKRTEKLKATRQYEEADRLWRQQLAESYVPFSQQDWGRRPKPEDFLKN